MLSVIITEDDAYLREKMTRIVSNYLMMEDLDGQVVLTCETGEEAIEWLKENPQTTGIYFLDVDLGAGIDGFALASAIRKEDPLGKIIFVTSQKELAFLTFEYKIEALDYIVKTADEEEMQKQVTYCLKLAFERQQSEQVKKGRFFQYKSDGGIKNIRMEDILFFETSVI